MQEQDLVSIRPLRSDEYDDFRTACVEEWGEDLSRVNDLSLADGRAEAARRTDKDLPDGIATPGHGLFVIALNGQSVGRLWFSFGEGRAFLDDITVNAEFRGRGIGTRALACMEQELRALDIHRIELSVDAINPRAKALYEQVGYQVTGFRMRKKLT